MLMARRFNPQTSREAEDPVIFTFICDTRRWKQVFTEPMGGRKTRTNPNGMKITRSFTGRIRSELKLEIPACKFQCKNWNVCERYARIYVGYWHCTANGCTTHVRVDGHRIASGTIRFRALYTRTSFNADDCFNQGPLNSRKCGSTRESNSAAVDSTTEEGMSKNIAIDEGNNSRRQDGQEGNNAASSRSLREVEEADSRTPERNELEKLIQKVLMDASIDDSNIRCVSVAPFCATYVSEEQLESLKNLRSSFLTLHVGPVGSQLQANPSDLNKIREHAIVVCDPLNQGSPISLCEFLIKSDSVEAITMALTQFRDGAMKYIGLDSSRQIANRIEVGFYPSTIEAVIQVFFDCKSVSGYLNMCWEELAGSRTPCTMTVNVCAGCALDVFSREITKRYGQDSQVAATMIVSILKKILASEKMEEAVYYVRRLLTLCGSWTITTEVEDIMRCPEKQAPAEITSFDFNSCNLPQAGRTEGLHVTTNFGLYFSGQADMIEASGGSGAMLNELHCPGFITYLCEQALPYLPILTKVMMQATGQPSAGMPTYDLANQVVNHQQLRDDSVKIDLKGPSSHTDGHNSQLHQQGTHYPRVPEVASYSSDIDRVLEACLNDSSLSMSPWSFVMGWEDDISSFPDSVSAEALCSEGTTTSDPLESIKELEPSTKTYTVL